MNNLHKRIKNLEKILKENRKPYLYIIQASKENFIIKTRKNELLEFASISEIEKKFNYKIPAEDFPIFINLIPVNQFNKNE